MSISLTNDDLLQENKKRGTLSTARKVAIFSGIIKHLTAIVYLMAELILGFKPERL